MKSNRSLLVIIALMIVVASLYRVWDGRPFGFVPHISLAIFGGALIRDKRLALLLPIFTIFISDLLYEILWLRGITSIPGFYEGQWMNYLLFAGLTCFGFLMKRVNFLNVLGFSLSGSVLYFVFSNFVVWAGGGGLNRPKTFDGLMMCYADGLAFFRDYGLIQGFAGNVFIGELFFSAVLFGAWYVLTKTIALRPAYK